MACNSQFDGGTYPPGSSGDPRDCYNVTPNTHTTVPPPVSNSYVSSSISAGHVHGVTAQIKNHPTMIDSHVGLAEKEPYLTFSMESHKPTQKLSPTASTFQPPNKSSENILASYSQPMFACLSKDLGVSRYLIAASASINITHSDIVAYIANFPNLRGRYYTFERFNGVYVAFTDVRDSSNSFNNAAKLRPDWRMHYVESFDFYKHVGSDLREDKQKTDGVLNIIALMAPSSSHSTHRAASMVVEILSAYGQIFGIVGLAGFETGTMRAIVEYCDLESATAANIRCNGVSVDGIYISAFPGRMAAAAVDVTSPISRDGSSPDDLAVSLHHQGISGPEQTAGRLSVTRHAARESHPIGHHMHPFMMPIMHQPQISIVSIGFQHRLVFCRGVVIGPRVQARADATTLLASAEFRYIPPIPIIIIMLISNESGAGKMCAQRYVGCWLRSFMTVLLYLITLVDHVTKHTQQSYPGRLENYCGPV
jgi:hypothetical protein